MIDKKSAGRGNKIRVSFELPAETADESVFLVGDFNDWDAEANPLKLLKKGTWKATMYLEPDAAYEFRYFIDGKEWRNDEEADDYVSNPYFEENSVIKL